VTTTLSRIKTAITEVMSHSNVLEYVKSTKQYEAHHKNQPALFYAFHTAVSSNTIQSNNVPENYKDTRATPDVADRMKACRRTNGQTRIPRMLGGPTTIISPSKRISHEKAMDVQIKDKQTWRPEIGQPSIEIRSQRLFSSPRSTLLRKLCSNSFLHNNTSTIRTHKYAQL